MKQVPDKFINGSLQERQLAFLEDTASHFNSKNRGTKIGLNSCYYSPQYEGSEGCAIGRWVHEDIRKKLDEFGQTTVANYSVNSQIPDWLYNLREKFLTAIQDLHDQAINWNDNGLSVMGEEAVARIKRDFKLNP